MESTKSTVRNKYGVRFKSIFKFKSTTSTEYELVRSTTIFEEYEYEEYGVRSIMKGVRSTKSTEYGTFFEYGVQGVRSTKSTKVRASIPDWHI